MPAKIDEIKKYVKTAKSQHVSNDEILRYVSKNNDSELEHILQDAKIIYNDYIDFTHWYIKN